MGGERLFCVNVDFLLLEYYSKPGVMMIDYKHIARKGNIVWDNASLQALKNHCNDARVPFAVVLYDPIALPEPVFELYPMNLIA